MKRKILFIEQNIDGTIGGSHLCLLYLLKGLNKKHYDPLVLFYEKNSLIKDFEKESKVFVHNYHMYNKTKNNLKRKCINSIIYLKHIFTALYWLSLKKVSLIHMNNSVLAGYDLWLPISLILHIPCIAHERGYNSLSKLGRIGKYIINRYSLVVTVSDLIKENLTKNGIQKNKIITVYDGIDPVLYRSKVTRKKEDIKNELKINKEMLIIGMVGNVREIKGQEYLLDTLYVLKKKFNQFICLIVGDISRNTKNDIEFNNYLNKKINAYQMTRNIIMTGFRKDIPDIINVFDVQVNASIIPDAFPHVILEGMSLGKAIIATDLGGAKESVKDGVTGFIVSHNKKEEFADKLYELLVNKTLRRKMGRAAKERINKFHIRINIENTEKMYKKLIKTGLK